MRRRAPRPLSQALEAVASELAPQTPLAAIQRCWPEAVGSAIAREAQPVTARDGVLTVACGSGVWAQELTLMAPHLIERLNAALKTAGAPAVPARVTSLRCLATAAEITE